MTQAIPAFVRLVAIALVVAGTTAPATAQAARVYRDCQHHHHHLRW
jgi:hypothetical protein